MAEEKLWDSYRESDARENVLRKQMTQLQKSQLIFDLSEEHKDKREDKAHRNGMVSKNQSSAPADVIAQNQLIFDLQQKLAYYEKINVKQLVNELSEKTRILEEMIEEKQRLEKELKNIGFGHLVGYAKPTLKRPPTAKSRPASSIRQRARLNAALHLDEKFKSLESIGSKSTSKDSLLSDPRYSTDERPNEIDGMRYVTAQVATIDYVKTSEDGSFESIATVDSHLQAGLAMAPPMVSMATSQIHSPLAYRSHESLAAPAIIEETLKPRRPVTAAVKRVKYSAPTNAPPRVTRRPKTAFPNAMRTAADIPKRK